MPKKINKGVSHKKVAMFSQATATAVAKAFSFPAFKEPTNDDRANWAKDALKNFTDSVGGDEPQTDLGDLLRDLMHLAKRDGLNFETALGIATMHFEAEVQEEYESTSNDANREMELPEREDWGAK